MLSGTLSIVSFRNLFFNLFIDLGKMKRTADILIAMDCSSSMNWSWEKYIKDCLEQFDQYFLPNSENLRLGFTAFRSHNDPIERYELTTSSEIFRDYLNQIRISNEIPTGSKSTGQMKIFSPIEGLFFFLFQL